MCKLWWVSRVAHRKINTITGAKMTVSTLTGINPKDSEPSEN